MKTKTYIVLLVWVALVAGCREVPTYDLSAQQGDTLKENMIRANRIIAQSEAQQIDAYIARRGWTMQRLTSGVRVMETSGTGAPVGYEDTVALRYRVATLGGDELYGWRSDTVVCGRLQPTRGLDAALRTLHHGSSAQVIVPSEMAYGVMGDGDRIRSRMVLVYEVTVE